MYKELFSDRHNSLSTAEEQEMVQMLGYNSIEQLISQTIPDEIRLEKELNLDEALNLIQKIAPKRCYLTHISHFMGFHDEVSEKLPPNVFLAYDTLTITSE